DKSLLMKLLSLITPWEFEEVLVAHRYPSMLLEGFLYSVFPPIAEMAPIVEGVTTGLTSKGREQKDP
ncbi:MAG: hypothetical protein QW290_07045, partial [Sulfolobales archaeon]